MNAETRIRRLAESNLTANRDFNGVQFIDELLDLATEVGEIKCSFAGDRKLRFQTADQLPWEIEFDRAEAKLRMLCARLAVLCNETGRDQDVSLYGGAGVIEKEKHRLFPAIPEIDTSHHLTTGRASPGWGSRATTQSQPVPVLTTVKYAVQLMNTPGEHWFVINTQ